MRSFLFVMCLGSVAFAQPRLETRISLEVQKADVHSVLRLFANASNLNLIVDDSVQGQVSLKLKNVTLREAFAVVLATHQLGYEKLGNIMRVAPMSALDAEASQRVRIEDARQSSRPLKTTLIPVNYARAADLVTEVKATLSPRGSVSVDARTNTLIVRDVE